MSTIAATNLKNASSGSNNIVLNADGSTSVSNDLKFNSGYGSAAVAYGCRAWVNFNGTGVVAIRESGNVSSITDNAVGDYTVNFTTAMVDANYSVTGIASQSSGNQPNCVMVALSSGSAYLAKTTSGVRIYSADSDGAYIQDSFDINVAIFR